jgi:signal transduction histidine kinase
MKTIRGKLFLIFIALMVAMVALVLLFDKLLLERYYVFANRSIFMRTSAQISDAYAKDRPSLQALITSVDRVEAIGTTVVDPSLAVLMTSFPADVSEGLGTLPPEIRSFIGGIRPEPGNGAAYGIVTRPNDGSRDLVHVSPLPDGNLLILKKPMKGIVESAAISFDFTAFAGAAVLLLGCLAVFLFSKRLTRPIVEMGAVAEDISNLKFDRRADDRSRDEIGRLGRSVNRISEKLSAAIDGLRQDVERRKRLVRDISHELKTPIGVIKGYAEGLRYNVAADKAAKYCETIAAECDRMDRMVRELLDESMMEAGDYPLRETVLPVRTLFDDLSERFGPLAAEAGVRLEFDDPGELAVRGDALLLVRALGNFLNNALRHAAGDRIVRVGARRGASSIELSVFNTCDPLPSEELEAIWDIFVTGDRARSRGQGGHGLGLSIAKAIAERHGGGVSAANVPGGVEFSIRLPEK